MSETEYRPIDIDFEIYQLIVLEKRGFDESDNAALRRLLGLVPGGKELPKKRPTLPRLCGSQPTETGRRITDAFERESARTDQRKEDAASWSGKGVVLPEGTRLRMTYGSAEHNGVVVGGKWEVEGERYNTPSQAASSVARTRRGEKTRLNGWKLWHVKRPSDASWIFLDRLRDGNRG